MLRTLGHLYFLFFNSGNVLVSENTAQCRKELNWDVPNVELLSNDDLESCNTSVQHCSKCSVNEARINELQNENTKLKEELATLKKRMFNFEIIVENEDLCKHYCGLSAKVLKILSELLLKISENCKWNSVNVLTYNDQLLLTLTKLRRNLSNQDLAFRFGVSGSTVQSVFTTTVQLLHQILFVQFMGTIPSRVKNQMFIPKCFQPFPSTRIVIDCTEVSCDVPKNMAKQKTIYSNYKEKCTVKFLICCAPNGCITYCSSAYPGSTSDRAIVEHSGILSQFVAGDLILADKGFLIAGLLPPGVSLDVPAYLDTPQFTANEVVSNRTSSRGRIHVERINSRVKHFQILKHFPRTLFSSCEQIVQLCCALVNLQNPILSECINFFESLCQPACSL